uniref:Uncharacterized protein n=1 Tax=Pristionchus pacificus TaxID=54126 RepID=A0A2A6BVR2_PRIPA|eukprot:PDM69851.1 hypothetical protein PRIPAC_49058 [Pristionchus pacificus]
MDHLRPSVGDWREMDTNRKNMRDTEIDESADRQRDERACERERVEERAEMEEDWMCYIGIELTAERKERKTGLRLLGQ